jgi:hypothetical protein
MEEQDIRTKHGGPMLDAIRKRYPNYTWGFGPIPNEDAYLLYYLEKNGNIEVHKYLKVEGKSTQPVRFWLALASYLVEYK